MSKNSVLKSYSGSFYYITRDAKLGIYPTPATGKELKVYYTPTPLEMTQDTTEPEIDKQYHLALVYYAAARVMELKGDLQQAQYFDVQFLRYKENAVMFGHKKGGESYFKTEYNDF
tara:strand:+ start:261 stop:608 length:348 start_codon:yes stop_codon:yes gene_type:complete